MKCFLLNITKFFSILFLLFLINTLLNYAIFYNSNLPVNANNILIAGDSHPERALNPDFFISSDNIAQGAEPYVLTYWKLRYIFEYIRPKILLLGFSHHNISAFNDMKFSDTTWSTEMFMRSYIIQNFEIIKGIKFDYYEFFKIFFRQMCLYPHTKHFLFIGRYISSDMSDLSDIETAINRHYHYNNKILGVSQTAIAYLDLIIALCKSKGIIPILIGSPVHEKYFNLIPTSIKYQYELEKKRLRKNGINIFDFTNKFYNDSFYLNSDHLNNKGASKFTKQIKLLLNMNI